ncbi:hypothetical protein [Streptomyces sp900105755]|uniref:Uncharacterized protein n=1 Tax=Streptomyces sp. 900105755 TaxID=3154389 RepID=A0ABV1TBI4_9ACTN
MSRPSARSPDSAARTSTPVTGALAEALLIRLGAADGGREDVGLVVLRL